MIGEAVALHADALLDNIAEMDAGAEFDGSLGRQAGVAHDHAVLDLDCAPHLVHHTAKFDEEPVAGALDNAPVMRGGRTLGSINPWKRRGRQRAQTPVPRRSEVRTPQLHQEVCGSWHDFLRHGIARHSDGLPLQIACLVGERCTLAP
jgi:hypothetical protein